MNIEVLVDCHATIGESPTWSPRDGAIYWIDVKEPALHRVDREAVLQRWPLPTDVGAFALTDGPPGAVVALRTGLFDLDLSTGRTSLVAPPPFDPDRFRFNEGICDVHGRFWVGAMFDPRPGHEAPTAAAPLHRFTRAEGLVAEPDLAELHNGAAWSPDGRSLLLSHSNEGTVCRYPYDPETGTIGSCQLFARVAESKGVPDGAAVDEEGCYWSAVHGGSALHRYDPEGQLVGVVDLPVSQPTMCAFVGDELDAMVVTSATDKLTPEQRAREPLAGAILRLRPGVRGIPRPCVVR
ncbi:SMP-30/gluconolactonase/LRE family protein [Aureimonas leprariae]|uniref:SMP-30/gluconolactonase/LRE family protein n=1 Tax=Plantimonas leprariae TaxID=2615207 RepID=A0A7V7PK49_9HYPH|nr:SMP-30/gluconolactonase/LRE family protein [Aureimonas leprariae]KAB0675615.1 SMP-30/gluconolactonase/LRE family protein [Aureimonas leprariae]